MYRAGGRGRGHPGAGTSKRQNDCDDNERFDARAANLQQVSAFSYAHDELPQWCVPSGEEEDVEASRALAEAVHTRIADAILQEADEKANRRRKPKGPLKEKIDLPLVDAMKQILQVKSDKAGTAGKQAPKGKAAECISNEQLVKFASMVGITVTTAQLKGSLFSQCATP